MACCSVHPLSTALFLLGYGLALPIAARLATVVERQQRLAMWGHQAGVLLATLGWVLRGQILVAAIHVVWLLGAYGWFELRRPKLARR